ncbi:hypothetical protein [Lysobacter gummosus]|uniref:hypothetical protein n=1 Tax=Lysobacter gummosus TaxID=262324 RepID=UPI00362567D6
MRLHEVPCCSPFEKGGRGIRCCCCCFAKAPKANPLPPFSKGEQRWRIQRGAARVVQGPQHRRAAQTKKNRRTSRRFLSRACRYAITAP